MNDLTLGTVVSVDLGVINHFGLVSGFQANGTPVVISSSKKLRQVAEESIKDFAEGYEVTVHGFLGRLPAYQVVERARRKLGAKYQLFDSNCEHFVRWAHDVEIESPQLVVAGLLVCLVGAGTYLYLRSSR